MADVDLEVSRSDNPEMNASEAFSGLVSYYKDPSSPWGRICSGRDEKIGKNRKRISKVLRERE